MIINSCCYLLMIIFMTSTYAYIIDSDELRNSLNEQQLGLNVPLYYDRFIRTTKFPRIGRSPSDIDEIPSAVFYTTNEENDENNSENEYRYMEQRSVLFPRIGKRGIRTHFLGNRLSYPYYMLDVPVRSPIHQYQPQITSHHRNKRDLSM